MDALGTQLPWFVAGPLLGLVVVGGYWVGNQTLGGVGSFAALQRYFAAPREGASWRVYFLGGLIVGGLVYALLSGTWSASFAYGGFDQLAVGASPWTKAGLLLGGGLLMGLGAKHAGGCTLGHGLCGSATLSPASLAATCVFMGTAVAVAHVLFFAGVL